MCEYVIKCHLISSDFLFQNEMHVQLDDVNATSFKINTVS